MEKQKHRYQFVRYKGIALRARREIPFEMQLSARLLLDELCFYFNKDMIATEINRSIDNRDIDRFKMLSEKYKEYIKN